MAVDAAAVDADDIYRPSGASAPLGYPGVENLGALRARRRSTASRTRFKPALHIRPSPLSTLPAPTPMTPAHRSVCLRSAAMACNVAVCQAVAASWQRHVAAAAMEGAVAVSARHSPPPLTDMAVDTDVRRRRRCGAGGRAGRQQQGVGEGDSKSNGGEVAAPAEPQRRQLWKLLRRRVDATVHHRSPTWLLTQPSVDAVGRPDGRSYPSYQKIPLQTRDAQDTVYCVWRV